ncbi:hypothetical protein QDR37_02375 [Amnibacterium sp. CER49]|uniref:hypothetical protein n=1 Tax=Amnibacterium sp. CER49 TaxID=3039161 RepID=UPI00244694B1|nr:hypothetical protein [Amnibacterium sp. CER49]MDH2442783.1 hypothetical protein [Amnibacterium sp. CER49]
MTSQRPAPSGFRGFLQRMPLPVYFVVLFVLVTGVGIGLRAADHHLTPFSLVLRLVYGLVLASVLTAAVARRRRRVGGTAAAADFQQALKTGEVPADADRDGWRQQLEIDRRRVARSRWFAAPFFGLIVLFGAYGLVAVPRAALWGGVLVVLGLALGTFAVVQQRRVLPRIDRLLRRLDDR